MNTRLSIFFLLLFLLAPLVPAEAWGFEELTDQELNAVTAGNSEASHESVEALRRIPFRFSNHKGEVDGEVFIMPMNTFNQQGTLQLMDNAQSNLQSLINVNAVNSPVQILLNLNINVNSTIGNINQLNNLLSTHGSWR
jgi:hypothetical protein